MFSMYLVPLSVSRSGPLFYDGKQCVVTENLGMRKALGLLNIQTLMTQLLEAQI